MLISEQTIIEGTRVMRPIGKIMAVSAWRARASALQTEAERLALLRALMARAEDVDADAVVAFDCRIDETVTRTEGGIELERLCATGIAVRLALAA